MHLYGIAICGPRSRHGGVNVTMAEVVHGKMFEDHFSHQDFWWPTTISSDKNFSETFFSL